MIEVVADVSVIVTAVVLEWVLVVIAVVGVDVGKVYVYTDK